MKKELPKVYEPKIYEDQIYDKWDKSGVFQPDNISDENEKYLNIIPPPNANGELHIGHASGYVVMDLLGRYNRMLGKKVLLLPGKDHAGIQTQVVYEKKIKEERDLTKYDLGREKFYKEVYDFCIDRSQYMRNQEKKLGLGADWSREKFTLDPKVISTAIETFIQMYNEIDDDGNRMVYRGERIINWCPRCESALSDFEVEHKKENGKLYWIKYGPFVLATTRPETKLGDTAVAVHPDDERYKDMVGKNYTIKGVLGNFEIKVVADKEVDMEFGSGAIKVTPAHSFVDNEIATRHNLPSKKIIDESGRMMKNCGKYAGMTTAKAREAIVVDMEKMGLLDHIDDDYDHSIAVCERCGYTIEPIPSEQWFVNVDHKNFSLKKEARKVVESEKIKIYPARFKKVMLQWIDNVHDWCISRQIWWGPRIPAWYKDGLTKVQIDSPGDSWKQDEDTFDTWFSSGQWAYTTLDYPDGKDFKDFFPSDNMIMGRDILPLWSFRMIILSLYRTRSIPFKNLYFTGLVRDEHGKKMSKSKGNGIEPLEMIEKYGTDAVRMSLLVGSSPGNDMNLGEAKIEGYRNFVNKLWNISKFVVTNTKQDNLVEIKRKDCTLADLWILQKTKELIDETTKNINGYRFSQAGESLRSFMWEDFADWYVEVSKFEDNKEIKNTILTMVMKDLLRLWHPFIPFVTEAIWKNFDDSLLASSSWPKSERYMKIVGGDRETNKLDFETIKSIIIAIRNARAEYRVAPGKKIDATIYGSKNSDTITSQANIIKNLRTGIEKLDVQEKGQKITKAIYLSVDGVDVYIPLEGIVDFEKEKKRLQKELEKSESFAKTIATKLQNEKFTSSAPKEIVDKEKEKAKQQEEKIEKIQKFIKSLG
ncbi:MAG: valine--tRNA ligase [Patescibacteria group bacterium]|nr:valine--tRNA ligase [Patescibacteria group bacterium]